MAQLGRKIAFDLTTGNVIVDTGEMRGGVFDFTVEQFVSTFTALSERNRDTFDVVELAYGEYAQEFAECNGYRVNPETKKLEFSHPVPGEPEAPQEFGKPLTEQIEELKAENNDLMMAVVELAESNESDKLEMQLGMVELAEMIMTGAGE